MRIEYEGESYEFDWADITVKQAIKIEKHLGCPIAELGERLSPAGGKNPDMLAIQCFGWLILHGGAGVPIEDADFKVKALTAAVAAAVIAERDAQQNAAEPAASRPVPTGAAPASNGHQPDVAAEQLTVP